jgi:uncharacterized protein
MTLVDANLLLYAYNTSFPAHEKARRWLETLLSSGEPVRLAWTTVIAFLRIATNPRAFPQPLLIEEAIAIVTGWFEQPLSGILEPGEDHWAILSDLLASAQVQGPLVTDAHLAALAIEHGALLASSDADFRRFPNLRFHNPLLAD